LALAALAAAWLATLNGLVLAQAQQFPPYEEAGTVFETGPMGLLIQDTKGTRVLIQPNPMKVSVTVAGTAEPGFLKSGQLVRFEAKLDSKGIVKDEITKLAVVTQSENAYPRLDADIGPGDDLKELEKKGPVNYLVVGKLKSFKNGQLQVATPDKEIKAKLAEKPEITVDLGEVDNLALVGEGDKVEDIKGKLVQTPGAGGDPTSPGIVYADVIKITLSKPLTGKKATKGKKTADKKTAGKKPKKKEKRRSDDGFGNFDN
jgi:hypothetical protein